MTTSSVLTAERWLNGVALDSSKTLFFIGRDVAALGAGLQRRQWRGRVVHVAPPSFDGLDQVVSSLDADAERPLLVLEPDVARQHTGAVKVAARAIGKAWFGARANQEARRQNAGRYLLNSLRNLQTIVTEADAAALDGAFDGVPAIVVAAGPSLDRNLPEIARHRTTAVLIAVDTALRPLLAAGVHPDFVVAADPTEANARHLVDLPACPATYLVAEGSIDPEAFAHFVGRTFVFNVADHHPWPWLQANATGRGRLRTWGSVLTTAYDFTLKIGCSPIIFAGADLAFSDGRPYATGTTYDEEWRRCEAWGDQLADVWASQLSQWPDTRETGVDGAVYRTAPHLRSFRDWIVQAASTANRTTYNATAGGILVGNGVAQRSLEDVLSGLPSIVDFTRQTIVNSHRNSAAPDALTPALPGEDERKHWKAFASVTDEQIDDALRRPQASRRDAELPIVTTIAKAPTPEQRDANYVARLSEGHGVSIIRLTDASMDLLAGLRDRTADLDPGGAVIVVDELYRSVGAQTRQAIDSLLADRDDLWVQHRRFSDRQSRVSVIRRFAHADAAPFQDADHAKRAPEHTATAETLAAVVHRVLEPRSIMDIGCGAGHWIDAFKRLGVTSADGVATNDPAFLEPADDRRSDVCLCIEIAHGIPWAEQDALIERCVRSSDVIVFSSRPPGGQTAPSFERPLRHWAEKFWRHGYVIEDSLRPVLETQFDFPRNAYDFLFVFRRRFDRTVTQDAALTEWVLGSAARLYEMQMQRSWWLMQTYDLRGETASRETPKSAMTAWPIPAARLLPSEGGRVFRFRSDAARWYLSHPGAALQVFEDGVAARSWTRWRDDLTIASSDGTDPRLNGRCYSLLLPEHVARAEDGPHTRPRR